jgi:hypothetical protein
VRESVVAIAVSHEDPRGQPTRSDVLEQGRVCLEWVSSRVGQDVKRLGGPAVD